MVFLFFVALCCVDSMIIDNRIGKVDSRNDLEPLIKVNVSFCLS